MEHKQCLFEDFLFTMISESEDNMSLGRLFLEEAYLTAGKDKTTEFAWFCFHKKSRDFDEPHHVRFPTCPGARLGNTKYDLHFDRK